MFIVKNWDTTYNEHYSSKNGGNVNLKVILHKF